MNEQTIRETLCLLADTFSGQELLKIEAAMRTVSMNPGAGINGEGETALIADPGHDAKAYRMFFVSKKIEGLSAASLKYYAVILRQFSVFIRKPLPAIAADDIRFYLASKSVSPTTLNNERRVLSSFFGWLCNEEYIPKNPMLKIKSIKEQKKIKEPLSASDIEELRDTCKTLRDKAIVEILLSTGMRVSELCKSNKADVDLSKGEILVTGKGNKQRICYINAAAKKRLTDYLKSRNDNHEALFLSWNNNRRLQNGGVELLIRGMGNSAGIKKTHPHRLRRTAATIALKRGMPIEQVQIMLGHEKIDTTMRYAITADEAVRHAHSKYM
ncbi:MAG: tyrosine-type recombinase/integrase [Treponema sp.]|nr:tyrosine-type recombinase/integrase [Treponema sp.]